MCAVLMSTTGPEGRARAFFSAPPPTVVFCANRLHSAREVEETMVHELIHAYDVRYQPHRHYIYAAIRSALHYSLWCTVMFMQFTVRKMDITKSDLLACRCVALLKAAHTSASMSSFSTYR